MQMPAKGIHYSRLNTETITEITLIGCGGTGSALLTLLARIHLSSIALGGKGIHVRAYDGDQVSSANIGRQNFAPCDVGHNKAEILITRINAYYGLEWKAFPSHFDKRNHQAHIYISCVDSAKARCSIWESIYQTNPYNQSENYPYWIDCGNMQKSGQVVIGCNHKEIPEVENDVPVLPNILEMYPELTDGSPQVDDDSGPSCSLAEALESQDILINPTIANIAAQMIWQLIRYGKLSYHAQFVNMETGAVLPKPILLPPKQTTDKQKD